MTAVLTRDQADLLAAYGWQTADMLINPERGISAAKAADSGAATHEWWWDTDGKGIHAWRRSPDGGHPKVTGRPVEVPWSLLRAAAKAVPGRLLADLGAARRRTQREWLRHFPEFVPWMPGGRAPWVDPPPHWHRDAEAAQRAALDACLDALVVEPDGVPGQLDLFAVAS